LGFGGGWGRGGLGIGGREGKMKNIIYNIVNGNIEK
jgi:hypothetical protein